MQYCTELTFLATAWFPCYCLKEDEGYVLGAVVICQLNYWKLRTVTGEILWKGSA